MVSGLVFVSQEPSFVSQEVNAETTHKATKIPEVFVTLIYALPLVKGVSGGGIVRPKSEISHIFRFSTTKSLEGYLFVLPYFASNLLKSGWPRIGSKALLE